MDYSKLRGRIAEMGYTIGGLADAMPLSRTSIWYRLNSEREWTAQEIARVCELLEIPLEEAHLYFFTAKH